MKYDPSDYSDDYYLILIINMIDNIKIRMRTKMYNLNTCNIIYFNGCHSNFTAVTVSHSTTSESVALNVIWVKYINKSTSFASVFNIGNGMIVNPSKSYFRDDFRDNLRW